jgi:mono/diheme cytochrome c family protein/glucose/arabinose dehydrogenase
MSEPASASPPPPRSRKLLRVIISAVLAIGVLVGAGAALHNYQKKRKGRELMEQRLAQKKKAARRKQQQHKKSAPEPVPPFTPDEALASFTVQPGFRVELVASEPLVKNPVALAFDPDGRVWVCEMQGYMPNARGEGEGAPIGDVVMLEDTDGDGKMDKRTVFIDGLVLPRAIALVKGGLLVAEPPALWFCPDRDGDGHADEKIAVDPQYNKLVSSNPEHMPNGLMRGIDNWIYNAKSATRYREDAGAFRQEKTAFRGQWGIAQDDWGRLYYNYHISQLHADIFSSAEYLERPQSLGNVGGLNVALTTDQRVWPSHPTPGVNGGKLTPDKKLQVFTSACGLAIYRGELFPREFRGNPFICEPAGNLVKRNIAQEAGGLISARSATEGAEFLTSLDERFRPVNLYTGPDGALWVVDMYCGILEHSTYMGGALKRYIEEHKLAEPAGWGRIWRIVPEEAKTGALPKLPHTSTAELVAQLENRNGWWRDTAQRLLVEQHDAAAAPLLRELLVTANEGATRLHVLWTLESLGALDEVTLRQALGDPEPKIRAAALRLSEPLLAGNPGLTERVMHLLADRAEEVWIQLMLTLGALPYDATREAMLALLSQANGHPYVQRAALTSLHGHELEFLEALFATEVTGLSAKNVIVIQSLTAALLQEGKPERADRLFALIATQPEAPRDLLVDAVLRNPELSLEQYRPIPLAQEPAWWKTLAGEVKPETLSSLGELFTWPGKPSKLERTVVPLNDEQQRRFTEGKALFGQICGVCHQPSGQGLEGLAPPLVNSPWVLGSEERLVRIVLNGLAGAITVNRREYTMEMPALGALSDEQIAAILTYLRREWGHRADPVDPPQVAEIRAAVGARARPWTAITLGRWQ